MSSHRSQKYAVPWRAGGHTNTTPWCVFVCVCVCLCVCVCVTYVLSSFNLLHFISDTNFLRLPIPDRIRAIRQLRSLPYYTPTTTCPFSHFPNVFLSRPSRSNPLYLSMPGREQCHQRSIRQLCSLPNARPFVARAAGEQAVRPHYC